MVLSTLHNPLVQPTIFITSLAYQANANCCNLGTRFCQNGETAMKWGDWDIVTHLESQLIWSLYNYMQKQPAFYTIWQIHQSRQNWKQEGQCNDTNCVLFTLYSVWDSFNIWSHPKISLHSIFPIVLLLPICILPPLKTLNVNKRAISKCINVNVIIGVPKASRRHVSYIYLFDVVYFLLTPQDH